jgi:P-type conjugative transfer protein TrbJ
VFGVGDLVYDPLNTAQNTLTAIRSLISNTHEVTVINQQVRQLANDAQNLVKLPLSVVGEIQQTMFTYQSLLNQGRAMAYQVQASLSAFDQLFSRSDVPLTQRAMAIFTELRNAGRLATQVQSIYDQLCMTTTRIEQLGHASQAARGNLEVQQVGNQMLVVLAEQQNGIRELQATTARLQTMMVMQQVLEEEAARQHAEQMLRDWPTTLGGTTGFKLP